MKNSFKNFYLVLFSMFALGLTSCGNDDDFPTDDDPSGETIDPSNWQGTIEESMTLDASETYNLTGVISVESGATLTIPAGTEIVAATDDDENPATNVYIVIHQGAKIRVNGTAENPVVMRAGSGESGSWGGLLLAGNAVTTAQPGSEAEVGGIIYGGTNPADNSGSISYLILSDAGASIDPESQFNGLSLYAVGSGTSISNVVIKNGADDGVEFFGGSVSVTNLYLENNEDDAVDWTEGWDGGVENVYVSHTIANFSTAIEADGQNNMPSIKNFTAVSSQGGIALQFKKQSGAVFEGLSLTGYATIIDLTETGRTLTADDITIDGEVADMDEAYNAEPTVDVSIFDWAM